MHLRFRTLKKRVRGLLLLILGALAVSAPMTVGRWSLAILGFPLIALSMVEAMRLHVCTTVPSDAYCRACSPCSRNLSFEFCTCRQRIADLLSQYW